MSGSLITGPHTFPLWFVHSRFADLLAYLSATKIKQLLWSTCYVNGTVHWSTEVRTVIQMTNHLVYSRNSFPGHPHKWFCMMIIEITFFLLPNSFYTVTRWLIEVPLVLKQCDSIQTWTTTTTEIYCCTELTIPRNITEICILQRNKERKLDSNLLVFAKSFH